MSDVPRTIVSGVHPPPRRHRGPHPIVNAAFATAALSVALLFAVTVVSDSYPSGPAFAVGSATSDGSSTSTPVTTSTPPLSVVLLATETPRPTRPVATAQGVATCPATTTRDRVCFAPNPTATPRARTTPSAPTPFPACGPDIFGWCLLLAPTEDPDESHPGRRQSRVRGGAGAVEARGAESSGSDSRPAHRGADAGMP